MEHNYTQRMTVRKWETVVSPSTGYGYFERETDGEGGGLWFEQNELRDFDGVYALPSAVAEALRQMGYVVCDDF